MLLTCQVKVTGWEVLTLACEPNEKRIRIDWQFSVGTARGELNRYRRAAHEGNAKYQKT